MAGGFGFSTGGPPGGYSMQEGGPSQNDVVSKNWNPRPEVKVMNIDPTTSKEELKELFSQVGEVIGVDMISPGWNVGAGAYVTFKEFSVASDAYHSLNGQLFKGMPLTLGWSGRFDMYRKPKWFRIFVGNLPSSVDDHKLKILFEPYGKILKTEVMKRKRNMDISRRFGFVTFESYYAAKTAIDKMDQAEFSGYALAVNWATLRRKKCKLGEGHLQSEKYLELFNSTFDNNRTVYVGHLPVGVSRISLDKLLRHAFRKYGRVERIWISKREKYAFVSLDTKMAAAFSILGLDGMMLCGAASPDSGSLQTIRCRWANIQMGVKTYKSWESCHRDDSATGCTSGAALTANGTNSSSQATFSPEMNQQNLMPCVWNTPQEGGYGIPMYQDQDTSFPTYGSNNGCNYFYYGGGINSSEAPVMYCSPAPAPAFVPVAGGYQQQQQYMYGDGYNSFRWQSRQSKSKFNYSDQHHLPGCGGRL